MNKFPKLSLLATGFLLAWGSLYAAEPVGKVLLLVGSGSIQRGAQQLTLARGAVVENGDLIRIDDGSQAQIRFADDSMIALRSNSELKVEEFRYTEKGEGDKSVFSLLKGGLRTITGAIGKRNPAAYEMKGGAATIGIRGTHYTIVSCDSSCRNPDGTVVPKGLYGGVSEGRIVVSNQADAKEFAKEQYFTVPSNDAAIKPLLAPPAFLREKPETLAKAATKPAATQAPAASTEAQKKTTTSATTNASSNPAGTETAQSAATSSSNSGDASPSVTETETAKSSTSNTETTGSSSTTESSTTTTTSAVTPVTSTATSSTVQTAATTPVVSNTSSNAVVTTPTTTTSSESSGGVSSGTTSTASTSTGTTSTGSGSTSTSTNSGSTSSTSSTATASSGSNSGTTSTASTSTGSTSTTTSAPATSSSSPSTSQTSAYTTLLSRLSNWWSDLSTLSLLRYYDSMNYAYAGAYSTKNASTDEMSVGVSASNLRIDKSTLNTFADASNAVVVGKSSMQNYLTQSSRSAVSGVEESGRTFIRQTDKTVSTDVDKSESAGGVVWGRFSEKVKTIYEDSSEINVESYRHWAVGDLLSYLPTSGLYLYSYAGGTSPTNQNGVVGSVTQGGKWLLNFDAMSLQTVRDLRWKMADQTIFSVSVPYQTYQVSTNGAVTSVTSKTGEALTSRTVCSGSGCVDAQTDLALTLYGYRAKGLGVAVSTVANYADGTTQTTQSVQVYKKDSDDFSGLLKYAYAEAKVVKTDSESTPSVSAGNVTVAAKNVTATPDLLNTVIEDKSSLQKYLKEDFTTTTTLVEEGKVINRTYEKTASKDDGSKSSAGNVAWGRFGETVTTKQEDGTTTVVNNYRHWAVGDPLSALPTSGKFTYEYVGGTSPTGLGGATGEIKQEGKWQLDFSNKTIGTTESFKWKMNNTGASYSLAVPKQTYVLNSGSASSTLTGAGGNALSSNTTCSGGGCVSAASSVAATLYGSGAKGLGVAISTTGTFANKSTQTMNSVQVYKKGD